MPGTRIGGQRAAATNRIRYGDKFYTKIGRLGGMTSKGGGFTNNPELARRAGQKGGVASSRRSKAHTMEQAKTARALRDKGYTYREIAELMGYSPLSVTYISDLCKRGGE